MNQRPPLRLILLVLAMVLFGVAAYLSTNLGERLMRLGFVALTIAWFF